MNRLQKSILILLSVIMLANTYILSASAVEPIYKVGAEYAASPYYTALTEVTLTGDGRYDTLAIAFSQLGYHEGDSEAEMNGANTSGTKNFAEYTRLYGKLDNGEGNGVSYGYSWCAAFASWCLRHAGVAAEAAVTEVSCRRMTDWYRERDRFYSRRSGYVPQPGDLIMFQEKYGLPSHVGLVIDTEWGRVRVIDGNGKENSVAIHEYHRSDNKIYGYCVPDYTVKEGTVYDFLPKTPLRASEIMAFPIAFGALVFAISTASVIIKTRARLARRKQEQEQQQEQETTV